MENINFKDNKDFAKCEKLAFKHQLDFREFPDAEYKYFDKLTALYDSFRAGTVSEQQAKSEKQKYKSDYESASRIITDYKSVYKAYQENVKLAGELYVEIHKAETRGEAYGLMAQLIGVLLNDEEFKKRMMGKTEGL